MAGSSVSLAQSPSFGAVLAGFFLGCLVGSAATALTGLYCFVH